MPPGRDRASAEPDDPRLYPLLEELDRLEELLDDLTELGLHSVDDIQRRMAQLNAEVDALE